MAMNASRTSTHLTRSEVWSNELKDILEDDLNGQSYVRWLSNFPDGDQLTIPSIGEATVRDYVDDTPVVYDALDTGEFTFAITEYKQSGNYITRKARQDAFYSAELEASFVPKEARALSERLETDIFSLGAGADVFGQGGNQTAADLNNINGAPHRFVASGTNEVVQFQDFATALYSLKKANVPGSALLAIVDPSVEWEINTYTNIVGGASQELDPRFQSLLESGIGSGMRFVINIFGFNVFVSNYLAAAGAAQDGAETVNSITTAAGVCNLMFSAAEERIVPFVGAWRQAPMVDSEFNKDLQREEYVTTARYGLKLFRPENLVVVLSDTDQVG